MHRLWDLWRDAFTELCLYMDTMTVEEVYKEINKDRKYYEKSGWWSHFFSGEILMQVDFAVALLKRCKENGIHSMRRDQWLRYRRAIQKNHALCRPFICNDLKQLNDEEHRSGQVFLKTDPTELGSCRRFR